MVRRSRHVLALVAAAGVQETEPLRHREIPVGKKLIGARKRSASSWLRAFESGLIARICTPSSPSS